MQSDEALAALKVADKSAPTERVSLRGHRALRRHRVSLPNRTYFVSACTHTRAPLFQRSAIAALVFDHLKAADASRQITLFASIVMPDHIHCVFSLAESHPLEAVLKHFRGRSAQAVNRALQRTGPVWQRGYFERLLRPNDLLEPILHYMWHNSTPPGRHFRCRREIWEWFRPRVGDHPVYLEWLSQNP